MFNQFVVDSIITLGFLDVKISDDFINFINTKKLSCSSIVLNGK